MMRLDAEELGAVLEEGVGVLVADRQLLVEAGRHVQARRQPAHRHGKHQQHDERLYAKTEEEVLERLDESDNAGHRAGNPRVQV
jgi:hypothetical protein